MKSYRHYVAIMELSKSQMYCLDKKRIR